MAEVSLQAEGVAGRPGPWRWLRQLVRQVVREPIAAGRLRDVGWPDGLRVVVLVCLAGLGVATVLVMVAEPLRRATALAPVGNDLSIPRPPVIVLLLLVALCLTTFLLACTHGPVWLMVLGYVVGVPTQLVIGMYGMVTATGMSSAAVASVLLVAAVCVAMAVWRRRGLGRYQFAILYGLVLAQAVVATVDATRHAVPFGFDLVPGLVGLQILLLAPLAMPMTFAAGTAPAEVSVTLSLRAATLLGRRSRRSVTYTVMAAVLVLAIGQTGWAVLGLDRASLPWQAVVATATSIVLWAGLGALVVRTRRRSPWRSADVAESGSALGLPAGVVLIGAYVPLMAVAVVLMVLAAVIPALGWSYGILQRDESVATMRGLAAVAALLVARWSWRRGQQSRAVVLVCAVVAVLPMIATGVVSPQRAFTIDPTLVTVALVVVLTVWTILLAVRGRLSETRAVGVLALGVLACLIPHRTILAEPLEFLFGNGVGLVLFGLWWQFLSASEIVNRSSARFGLSSRVLLLLTSHLLTTVVLAYFVLTRQPAVGGMQDTVAFGDATLGLAILAAAVIAVLGDIGRDRLPV